MKVSRRQVVQVLAGAMAYMNAEHTSAQSKGESHPPMVLILDGMTEAIVVRLGNERRSISARDIMDALR
jgi:hypothetical protein